MINCPQNIIESYASRKITRQQFINLFSAWQKANGINYDCKGTADRNGIYLTYRGITATLKNGVLCWKNNKATSIFNFQRQVDYAFNQESNAFKNACRYAGEACEASLHGDTDRRGEMRQRQIYFLKQAEKWSALWN